MIMRAIYPGMHWNYKQKVLLPSPPIRPKPTQALRRLPTQSAKYTFDKYVSAHPTSHNELNLLGEPISASKKVTDFLAGITAPSLSTAKENVIGDVC
jgi:hypothetical protein